MLTRVFSEGLAPLLEPLGFERSGHSLTKKGEGYAWLVEWLPQGEERFDLGLGAYYPALMAAARNDPAYDRLPKTRHPRWDLCAQITTLGALTGRPLWCVTNLRDLKPVIEEVTVLVLEQGLTWFSQRRDWRCVLSDDTARYRDVAGKMAGLI